MKRLKPLAEVKTDVQELKDYIDLVENYETNTLAQKVVKSYACTSSLSKTLLEINAELQSANLPCIEHSYVLNLIKSKPQDDLHKLVRSSYFSKVKSRHSGLQYNSSR
ncbi:hypothetical protein R0K05_15975 [Planococcus sp. SIMBA_160]